MIDERGREEGGKHLCRNVSTTSLYTVRKETEAVGCNYLSISPFRFSSQKITLYVCASRYGRLEFLRMLDDNR